MLNVTPRQLEIFLAVATTGAVGRAAESMHLSQPAVSMGLAELERLLGRKLFDRIGRRLLLNEAGRGLLPRAHEILERLRELMAEPAGTDDALGGHLRIGASNTVGNYLVGGLLGGFVRAHPQVAVHLAIANTERILAEVEGFAVDVGCVEGQVSGADIEVRPWRTDRLVVCVRPDHPLAQRRRPAAGDFGGARWILREQGSATRALTERLLAGLPPPAGVLELGQSEAIKQAVIAGLGIACLPEVAAVDAVAAGKLCVLRAPFLQVERTLTLLVHRKRYRGRLVQAFLDAASAAAPPSRGGT